MADHIASAGKPISTLSHQLVGIAQHLEIERGPDWNGRKSTVLAAAGRLHALEVERETLIEQCAVAAEAQDRTGREWVRDSLWDVILKRAGANVRALASPTPQAGAAE